MTWRADKQSAAISRLILLGEESKNLPVVQRHKRLGIVNAMNRDLRRRKYPSLPDHIAAFDQQALLDRQAIAGEIDAHPKMVIKVYSGHNDREYLPGFGGTIGGNSTGVHAYRRDDDGQIGAAGFIVDDGIGFSKQGGIQAGEHGSWDRVLSDHGYDFDKSKDILITHAHADHMPAIVDRARCGLLTEHTAHARTKDIRVLERLLKTEKIPRKNWPKMHALDGEGWIYLDDGKNCMLSAYYSTNAIPHSKPVTAFIIAPPPYKCDLDGRMIGDKPEPNPHYWVYAALGDMSFGEYNLPGYQGEKPPDTGFKRDLFAKFKSGMRQEYPDIPKEMRRRIERINVAETDPTSVHQEGFASDVVKYVNNITRVGGNWFKEMGLIVTSLSTADREHEGDFRAATIIGRNLTGDGAFLENSLTDMNVMGVNTDVIPRNPNGDNINEYLKWYAEQKELPPVEFHRRSAEKWKELVRNLSGTDLHSGDRH